MGTRAYFIKLKKQPKNFREINEKNKDKYFEQWGKDSVFLYNYLDTDIFKGYRLFTKLHLEEGICEFYGMKKEIAYKLFMDFYKKKHLLNFKFLLRSIKEDLERIPRSIVLEIKFNGFVKGLKMVKKFLFWNTLYCFQIRKEIKQLFRKCKDDEYIMFGMW